MDRKNNHHPYAANDKRIIFSQKMSVSTIGKRNVYTYIIYHTHVHINNIMI